MQLGSAECAHMDILNSVRATKPKNTFDFEPHVDELVSYHLRSLSVD